MLILCRAQREQAGQGVSGVSAGGDDGISAGPETDLVDRVKVLDERERRRQEAVDGPAEVPEALRIYVEGGP